MSSERDVDKSPTLFYENKGLVEILFIYWFVVVLFLFFFSFVSFL